MKNVASKTLEKIRPRRRFVHEAGAAPGTLRPTEEAWPTELYYTIYSPSEITTEGPVLIDDVPLEHEGVLWLDVVGTGTVETLEALGERFGLHPLALEDVVNVNQRPKLENYASDLFFVLRMIRKELTERKSETIQEQICLLVRRGLVITFQERSGDCFDRVRGRLQLTGRRLRASGSDYLAYALLDAVVDAYQPILDDFEERLEMLEDQLFEAPEESDLKQLHSVRREMIALRRAVAPARDVVQGLMRLPEAAEVVGEETQIYLRDAYDHVLRTIDQIDSLRELCASLIELYLSTVSNRTNDVMKVLTMIATIFIPLSFLAGLYGMNFNTDSPYNMPELGSRYGYPILLGVMAALAGALLVYFKKKKWL